MGHIEAATESEAEMRTRQILQGPVAADFEITSGLDEPSVNVVRADRAIGVRLLTLDATSLLTVEFKADVSE